MRSFKNLLELFCLISSFPQILSVIASNTDENPYMADGPFLFYTLKWFFFLLNIFTNSVCFSKSKLYIDNLTCKYDTNLLIYYYMNEEWINILSYKTKLRHLSMARNLLFFPKPYNFWKIWPVVLIIWVIIKSILMEVRQEW